MGLEDHGKHRALSINTVDQKLCVVANGYVFHDRQSKPCTSRCLASALIDSVETLSQTWNMLWLNPLTLIANGQGWKARV